MSQRTKGHLVSQGGLRGHSVGDVFPFIVFAEGTYDTLVWKVRYPCGKHSKNGLVSAQHAFDLAFHLKHLWLVGSL